MIAGQRAFRGDSAADTMSAILKEDPSDLSVTNQNVSPGLDRIVRHCLEKNPEQRFQSARDLAFDLEALSSVSGSGPAPAVAGPATRRLRLPLVAAVAALLGLLAGALLIRAFVRPASPTYRMLTFRKGTVLGAFFAPDGQTVVYSATWEGAPPRLFSTRPGSTESRSLGLPDGELLSMSSAGDLAIGLGLRDSLNSVRLARVALAGGAPRPILDRVRAADWSPDGKELAVIREIEGVDHLEYPIGKTIFVEPANRYARLARVSPKGTEIAVVEASVTGVSDVVLLDLSGHRRELAGGWTEVSGLAWRPDGRESLGQRGERVRKRVSLRPHPVRRSSPRPPGSEQPGPDGCLPRRADPGRQPNWVGEHHGPSSRRGRRARRLLARRFGRPGALRGRPDPRVHGARESRRKRRRRLHEEARRRAGRRRAPGRRHRPRAVAGRGMDPVVETIEQGSFCCSLRVPVSRRRSTSGTSGSRFAAASSRTESASTSRRARRDVRSASTR